MTPVKAANLTLRFLLELCMLAALAYWGTQRGEGAVTVLLSIAAPVAAAFLWGTFISVKAPKRLEGSRWLALQVVLFGAAAVALGSLGHLVLGTLLFVGFALNLAILHAYYSRPI